MITNIGCGDIIGVCYIQVKWRTCTIYQNLKIKQSITQNMDHDYEPSAVILIQCTSYLFICTLF